MMPFQMMFKMFGNNPMFQRAQQMAQGRNTSQMEEVCRNVCKQRGFDFDEMKANFEKQSNNMRMPGM